MRFPRTLLVVRVQLFSRPGKPEENAVFLPELQKKPLEFERLVLHTGQWSFKTGLIKREKMSGRVVQLYLGGDTPLNRAISGADDVKSFRKPAGTDE